MIVSISFYFKKKGNKHLLIFMCNAKLPCKEDLLEFDLNMSIKEGI